MGEVREEGGERGLLAREREAAREGRGETRERDEARVLATSETCVGYNGKDKAWGMRFGGRVARPP